MTAESVLLNQQRRHSLDLTSLRRYLSRVQRVLRLGRRKFNVCLMDDRGIQRLNAAFRGKPRPTDVLSFPWNPSGRIASNGTEDREFGNFLGDVVISVDSARRNAEREGHSTLNEVRWLILHGALHLLGYDHEQDNGEMVRLEWSLRERLGIVRSPLSKRRHTGVSRAHV